MALKNTNFLSAAVSRRSCSPKKGYPTYWKVYRPLPATLKKRLSNVCATPSAPRRLPKSTKGDKVCLIIADITRAWNHARDFTVHVVNELNLAGIPDEDIFIVFAQGTHRAHTDAEISNVWEKKWRDALPCTSMTAGIKHAHPYGRDHPRYRSMAE